MVVSFRFAFLLPFEHAATFGLWSVVTRHKILVVGFSNSPLDSVEFSY